MLEKKIIARGNTADVFEWGENKVLKLFKADIPKEAIENEYRINSELYKCNFPVVATYELIELHGRIGIVYEKMEGFTMSKLIACKPWRIAREARRLAQLHERIHRNVNLYLPYQKEKIRRNIALTELLDDYVKKKLYDYIEKLPDGNVLCHGDFHPDNILISESRTVIIDWMDATIGNPLADVARTSIILRFAAVANDRPCIERSILNWLRYKFYSEYIDQYKKITSVNINQIKQWELPIAAARLNESLSQREKIELLNFISGFQF